MAVWANFHAACCQSELDAAFQFAILSGPRYENTYPRFAPRGVGAALIATQGGCPQKSRPVLFDDQ
jgi:hypothetical protein